MTLKSTQNTGRFLPLFVLAVSVAIFVWTVQVAIFSASGQAADQDAMNSLYIGRDTRFTILSLLGNVSIGLVLTVLCVCVAAALLRGRLDLAIGAVVIMGGANVTTQVLKRVVIERPDFGLAFSNSLPSGHTTVAAAGVASIILVLPQATRHIAAVAAAFITTVVGLSTVAAEWHRPSDVIASLAVTAAWVAAVSVVLNGRWKLHGLDVSGAILGSIAGTFSLLMIGVRSIMGWAGLSEAAPVLLVLAAANVLFLTAVCASAPRPKNNSFHVEPPVLTDSARA